MMPATQGVAPLAVIGWRTWRGIAVHEVLYSLAHADTPMAMRALSMQIQESLNNRNEIEIEALVMLELPGKAVPYLARDVSRLRKRIDDIENNTP